METKMQGMGRILEISVQLLHMMEGVQYISMFISLSGVRLIF